jgi:hypothetical protein
MKPMANGIILKSNTVSPIECLRYALNLPTSVVITGVDSMEILDQACEAARTFRPLSDPELTALLSKTATAARGEFEPFKTSSIFDGTAQNPFVGAMLLRTFGLPTALGVAALVAALSFLQRSHARPKLAT